MTLKNLPEINFENIASNSHTSGFGTLDNYQVGAAVFEVSGSPVTIKVKGKCGEEGEEYCVPFRYRKTSETDWKLAGKEGVTLSENGQYIALITADGLVKFGFDRVAINLETAEGGEIGTVVGVRSQPRYSV